MLFFRSFYVNDKRTFLLDSKSDRGLYCNRIADLKFGLCDYLLAITNITSVQYKYN